MNSHVSAILLGVKDMERSKRFYMDLGWEIQADWKISVFFVPHGGSIVGFYGREGLAEMVGTSPDDNGFSWLVLNYIVRREARVDEVMDEANKAGATILKPAGKAGLGRLRRHVRGSGRLRLEHRLQRAGQGPAVRRIAIQVGASA